MESAEKYVSAGSLTRVFFGLVDSKDEMEGQEAEIGWDSNLFQSSEILQF